ncbi:S8 family serine peptidase [Dactylosporangium sp. CA-092794]|uniref:S8 family serine peptidase n=1 Tax=Dactylosporangium sp. CA-092794 TaxID=3239929 RepID=UPI003D943804
MRKPLTAGALAAAVAAGLLAPGGTATAVPAGTDPAAVAGTDPAAVAGTDPVAAAGAEAVAAAGGGAGFLADEWPAGAGTTVRSVRSIVRADAGPAAALTGQGVGIALVDTGIAPVTGLPAGQVVNGPDLSFESQSSQLRYLDTFGHGTHMAGIMVGNDTAAGTEGLAPRAKVTSVKVGTATGAADVSQMIAAIDWVVANRDYDPANPIRVLNLSYGTAGMSASTVDPLMYAVEQAWQAGIVVVIAAGNDGAATAALTNPAMDPFVVAVGASTTNQTVTTADDTIAPFTNGSAAARKVDLLAPGTSIVSLRDVNSYVDTQYPNARVGATGFKGSGTSQAAAVVSSAAALLLQQRPGLTPDQVKALLVRGATALPAGRNLRELNVAGSAALATPAMTQTFAKGNGTGPLETTRGGNHLTVDGVALSGERSIFGPWSSAAWAAQAGRQASWSGGVWMGYRMAGDTWTGAGGDGGTGQISGYAGKCVDVMNRRTANGTPIQLYDCNNTPAQYWSLQPDGSIRALGKCLDVTSAGTANGTKVQLYGCNGTPAQLWQVTPARQLVNVGSGKCLDVTGWNQANGTQLQIWDCGDQDNQRWVPPYTSRTWSAATWAGTPWTGNGSWSDPEWSGQYWTGHYWSGHYWSGHYWSADDWSTTAWS